MAEQRDLSNDLRSALVIECAKYFDMNIQRFPDGALAAIRTHFAPSKAVSTRTIKRYWDDYHRQQNDGVLAPNISNKRKGNCGRHTLLSPELREAYRVIMQEYADLWMSLSLRMLKVELLGVGHDLSNHAIFNHLKVMVSRNINLRVVPTLTAAQREHRCRYILNKANRDHGLWAVEHKYRDQKNVIHVDEKWFYTKKVSHKIRVMPGVAIPDRPTCRHKNHIDKVLFLVAVARPQMRPDGVWFDGKIGIWPCTTLYQARRNSVNRPAGTWEVKNKSITAEYYRELVLGTPTVPGVFAAIKARMPWMHAGTVVMQHDGAKPHTSIINVQEFAVAGALDGWDIRVRTQPAQSPDMNVLDLCFFASLQRRCEQIKRHSHTVGQLVEKVEEAWAAYDWQTLDRAWKHQFDVWNSILTVDGGNQYVNPHRAAHRVVENVESSVDLRIDLENYNRCFGMFPPPYNDQL